MTLTTDMGVRDHYVASVKGALFTAIPGVTVVDISHAIAPFDTAQAAFVLRNAYPDFPRGTIHLIGVNPEAGGQEPHVVVRHDGHLFVGADNGIFTLLFDGQPHEAFELTMKIGDDHASFPLKHVFVKAAAHLARGGTPETIGRKLQRVNELRHFVPKVERDGIIGSVIHVDSYGNLVTNITRRLFEEVVRGRPFRIRFGRGANDIRQISRNYGDEAPGERVALFGSGGMLEIAINKGTPGTGGGAASLFGMKVGDTVRADLEDLNPAAPRVTGQLRTA